MTDPRVTTFLKDVLLPAYTEIAASPRMGRDFATHIYRDAIDDPIHAVLATRFAEVAIDRDDLSMGPVILVEDRDPARRPAPFGGRFLAAPMLRACETRKVGETDILVAPSVMFQMQFDGDLHVFQHRYTSLVEVAIEKVTRTMILNHMLNSFSFFRIHALSSSRPW
jgi:hypothetical protein